MEESRFRITFDDDFDWKNFSSLPNNFKKLIRKAIDTRLKTNPLRYGAPLHGIWKGKYKLRVSFYRIIYEVHEDTVIVKIIAIGLRKNIYNKKR